MKLAPVAELQRVAAHYFELPARIMTNREYSWPAIRARQVAMYLAVVHLKKNKSEVARRFGNMDRTTVYHAVLRVCRTDELWRHAMAVKALLYPADNREYSTISKSFAENSSRTEAEQMQERIAA